MIENIFLLGNKLFLVQNKIHGFSVCAKQLIQNETFFIIFVNLLFKKRTMSLVLWWTFLKTAGVPDLKGSITHRTKCYDPTGLGKHHNPLIGIKVFQHINQNKTNIFKIFS